jgi:hypothetical protein
MKNFQEETSTLMKTETSKLAEHVENTNKKLSEDLIRQIREENAKLREEFARKLEAEVRKFENDMDKLRKDRDIEIVSLNQNVEIVREGLSEKLTGHITETDQRIDKGYTRS